MGEKFRHMSAAELLEKALEQARNDVAYERFTELVEAEKERLRKPSLWRKLVGVFTTTIHIRRI
jgi:hypothetical protein